MLDVSDAREGGIMRIVTTVVGMLALAALSAVPVSSQEVAQDFVGEFAGRIAEHSADRYLVLRTGRC